MYYYEQYYYQYNPRCPLNFSLISVLLFFLSKNIIHFISFTTNKRFRRIFVGQKLILQLIITDSRLNCKYNCTKLFCAIHQSMTMCYFISIAHQNNFERLSHPVSPHSFGCKSTLCMKAITLRNCLDFAEIFDAFLSSSSFYLSGYSW